jgi:hypothetical protein
LRFLHSVDSHTSLLPQDEEATKFFLKKDNKALLDQQYELVMNEYPETMFSVLMVYIATEINGVQINAFVDSGAQTSVMSLTCAKKCGMYVFVLFSCCKFEGNSPGKYIPVSVWLLLNFANVHIT